MSNNKNPFADFFNAWSDNAWLKNNACTGVNFDDAIAAGRLNAKAFSDAVKAASEGAQAVLRRQAEISQRAAEEASKYFKEATSAENVKNPEAAIANQAEFAQKSIENAISNSKELFEMASKFGNEASDIINKRVIAALSEVAANNNSKKKKASTSAAA